MTYQPLNIIPGPQYTGTDQYVIVDPTAPNHIHLRAGGVIDNSSADLYLGGEDNHFIVSDGSGTATISAQNEIYVAPVPVSHGGFATYLAFATNGVPTAGTALLNLGDETGLGTFKCIIHAIDATTSDTEAFEYLITQDGSGNIDDLASATVNSGGVGALVTASTSISGGDVILTLTNVAVSANSVNVRVQATALALG